MLVGPPVAGILVDGLGGRATLIISVMCFVVSAVSFVLVPARSYARAARAPWPRQLGDAFREAGRDPAVTAVLALSPLLFLGYAGTVYVALPAYATLALAAGARGLGVLYGAVGAGALVGATLVWLVGQRFSPRVAALMLVTSGLATALAAFAGNLWPTAALIALAAALGCTAALTFLTLVQSRVPESARARVMSLVLLSAIASAAISFALAGILVEAAGAPFTIATGGAVVSLSGLLLFRHAPAVRPAAPDAAIIAVRPV
jgi:predicted MFS family arabinose efflux permease